MKFTLMIPVVVVALLEACVADSPTAVKGPATPAGSNSSQPPTDDADGQGVSGQAPDTNPQGVAYPTTDIGVNARKGSTPGNRIRNYKFSGYPNGDVSQGLKPVSLAQYYDPTGTTYKLIHIQAAGSWCSACRGETETVVPLAKDLSDRKVVWLVSLAEGSTPGTPSSDQDLRSWIGEFSSPYTHVLDPGNRQFGSFYDRAALPWNANIDATTMEILTSGTGGAASASALLGDLDEALTMAAESTIPKAK